MRAFLLVLALLPLASAMPAQSVGRSGVPGAQGTPPAPTPIRFEWAGTGPWQSPGAGDQVYAAAEIPGTGGVATLRTRVDPITGQFSSVVDAFDATGNLSWENTFPNQFSSLDWGARLVAFPDGSVVLVLANPSLTSSVDLIAWASDGTMLWQKTWIPTYLGSPVLNVRVQFLQVDPRGVIFVPWTAGNGDGVAAFNAGDGSTLWEWENPFGPNCDPWITEMRYHAGSDTLWLVMEGESPNGQYCGYSTGVIVAHLDAGTGSLLFQQFYRPFGKDVYEPIAAVTPSGGVVVGGYEYFNLQGDRAAVIFAIDGSSHQLLWSIEDTRGWMHSRSALQLFGGDPFSVLSPILVDQNSGDIFYFLDGDVRDNPRHVVALDPFGVERWATILTTSDPRYRTTHWTALSPKYVGLGWTPTPADPSNLVWLDRTTGRRVGITHGPEFLGPHAHYDHGTQQAVDRILAITTVDGTHCITFGALERPGAWSMKPFVARFELD